MDLFEAQNAQEAGKHEPLASRMRPRSLAEFCGQRHILKEGTLLRRVIETDKLSSIILYGPPGCGKTTLALIISRETKCFFESVNAVTSGVAELRKVLDKSKVNLKAYGKRTILFVDEIHRFSRSQQDVLMPDVERGNPLLVGATTQNPFFAINSPLLSRSLVFELKALDEADVMDVVTRALADTERGLGKTPVRMDREALKFLAGVSEGDARRALGAVEIGVLSTPPGKDGVIDFNLAVAQESVQKKAVRYDNAGDDHYDHASALIKSMRGSDPDAAIYYLAKMLYAGEDPRFIARRIVICAAEDVGNADPQALVIANAAFQTAEYLGMPEARIPLAQAAVYLACAPKSNASYLAIDKAMKDVEEGRALEVPAHLKDSHYRGAEKLGRGVGYQYAHDHPGHHVTQDYLTEHRRYYVPTEQGHEKTFKLYLESLKAKALPPK
jgi:putative ATPase